jgi:hypothetical protein
MLATPRARPNAVAFLAGWIVALAGMGAIVLLVSSGIVASNEGQPKAWVGVLQLVLGIGLVILAMHQCRARPRGDQEPALPRPLRARPVFTGANGWLRRAGAMTMVLPALHRAAAW